MDRRRRSDELSGGALPARSLGALEDGLHQALRRALDEPGRLLTDALDLAAYASDASFYRLEPRAVVQPETLEEVARVVAVAKEQEVALTFRGAGTSLSGQAVTDGILVDLSRHWRAVEALEGGAQVRVEPGIIGAKVNAFLAPLGRRIGPDPASIDSCMMGGILANNASGMCCGVVENAYHTIRSVRVLLANGLVLDTAAPGAAEALEEGAPELARGLRELRSELLQNEALCARIREKYRQKNTTGYSLNALLDYDEPLAMLPRLLIGSEGTLAFIAEAVLDTLPTYPVKSTAFLLFDSPALAAEATQVFADSGARAVEFFDRASLEAVDAVARQLLGDDVVFFDDSSALLVEYQVEDQAALDALQPAIAEALEAVTLALPASFTSDAERQALIWRARKGLYPAVGAMRAKGTTAIIEDVAVALPKLPACVAGLQELFTRHGYEGSIIFGHAKDGNLHFVITQEFDDDAAVQRYGAFMDDLVELIAKRLDGALKAEHGTGRNIAPFVETEWGEEAHGLMGRLKALFDPEGVLNPGVIINDDPHCHLEHLKDLPLVGDEVDACVECGFCEKVCPSAELTLSPRRRIAALRHMGRLRRDDNAARTAHLDQLMESFGYAGLDTCAADGLCAGACPVAIDTGKLVKRLRGERLGPTQRRRGRWAAKNYRSLEGWLRFGLRMARAGEWAFGPRFVRGSARFVGWLAGSPMPRWEREQPLPPKSRSYLVDERPEGVEVILFPSCMSRIMGRPRGEERSQQEVLLELAARAGVVAWAPESLDGHCCGLSLASKGFAEEAHELLEKAVLALYAVSDRGRLPIVIDASSCTYTFRQGEQLRGDALEAWEALTFWDVSEFVHERLLPGLELRPVDERVFVHANCASRKLGSDSALLSVAQRCAREARIPDELACCATAGDRGLLFPELSESALKREKAELEEGEYQRFVSSNLTCETGLSAQLGRRFTSFLYLVEAATRP